MSTIRSKNLRVPFSAQALGKVLDKADSSTTKKGGAKAEEANAEVGQAKVGSSKVQKGAPVAEAFEKSSSPSFSGASALGSQKGPSSFRPVAKATGDHLAGKTLAHFAGYQSALPAEKTVDSEKLLEKSGGTFLERLGAARKNSARARNAEVLQVLAPQLETDQQKRSVLGARNTPSQALRVLDAKCELTEQLVSKLEAGTAIGVCMDHAKGALRTANKELKSHLEEGAKSSPADVEKLEDRVEGLSQAAAELRGQIKGWRGTILTLETGLSFGIPFLGGASLSFGVKLVGPDAAGGPMIRPYVKVAAGGGVGPVGGGGGYTVGRGFKGGSYNVGTTYLSYTPKDPVIGRSLKSTMPGVGAVMVLQEGFAGGGRLPILGLSPSAFIAVEHPSMASKSGAIFDAIDDAKEHIRETVQNTKEAYLS